MRPAYAGAQTRPRRSVGVDDARLVALNARAAAEAGARIETRMAVTRAERAGAEWRITAIAPDGGERLFRARALVNAAGPWVGRMFEQVIDRPAPAKVRLIRGSHIVLPRLYAGSHAYILQNDDKRVIFTIPYEGAFTLVGTTDVDQQGDPSAARISPEEIDYLCRAVGRWFKDAPQPSDIVWSYAGVRPLYDDGAGAASTVTRDYVLTLDAADSEAPLLSVFGGKITTFRRLAEDAVAKLAKPLGLAAPAWTARACLPGGDLPNGDREGFIADCTRRWSALPAGLVRRYAGAYGTRIERLLSGCATVKDLGEPFDAEIYEAELSYLADQEWARTAEDMLWRRTKLGLRCRRDAPARIAAWFAAR